MTWFSSWFDTPYYHTLYKHRNDEEAELFMHNLMQYIQPAANSRLLDLACGKGRHSTFLAKNNPAIQVVGVDLSPNSITYAQAQNTLPNCQFAIQNMLEPIRESLGEFDYIANLFTSFGYFDNDDLHLQTLQHIYNALTTNGLFVLDFMNVRPVIQNLVLSEQKNIDGIQFDITRYVENHYIVKTITIRDKNTIQTHQERVRAFTLANFRQLFEQVGFELVTMFGNYELANFDEVASPRLIIVARKK